MSWENSIECGVEADRKDGEGGEEKDSLVGHKNQGLGG